MRGIVANTLSIRGLLLLLAFGVIAPFAIARPAPAAANADENGPIARVALSQLDTWGGQCWTWMQQVVFQATGRKIGYDYRQGFFEAGAYEVSAEEARNGDIIQVAKDSDTSPWASYPGLHTGIILKNLGGGRFDVIDSNQNWDEWVRLRPNYSPYDRAAQYGLQVHIYRIPGGGPGDSAAAAAPAETTTLASGESARVAAEGGCLNLRSEPGLSGSRIACLQDGTQVTITGEAVSKDGFTWVPVSTPSGSGWVASRYLARAPAAVEPVAAPNADTAPAQEPPPVLPEPPPAPAAIFARTDNSPGCLRVRSAAGLAGSILDCLPAGTPLTIVDDSRIAADGYAWVRVETAGRPAGWVANQFLLR